MALTSVRDKDALGYSLDGAKAAYQSLHDDYRITKLIIDKKSNKITLLEAKDKRSIEMYNDIMSKHEALKAKWWYRLFTKLESWKR